MGIGKRLLDLARANLNALLDKAAGDARVEELTDEELELELERRRDRKKRDEAARVGARAAERAARERGAQRGTPPPPRTPPRPAPSEAQRIARLYATLETPNGADYETVKRNFRKLMRKYHPDLHAGSPGALKAATEKSASLTTAYQELERILLRR
jgi:DnaJ-domain-containing protein 1